MVFRTESGTEAAFDAESLEELLEQDITEAADLFAAAACPGCVVTYTVIDKSKVSTGHIDYGQTLATCSGAGSACQINSTKSATRTVSLSLGVSRSVVTSSLGISNASTQSLSISCSSPTLKSGQIYKAHPRGERHRYKVRARSRMWVSPAWIDMGTETSGWLYAFNSNGIHCRVT